MNPIDNMLHKLENFITNGIYEKIETDRYEVKDNSHNNSDWKEVYKTANAFLNSKGGIIFVGIHENEELKKYTFTGFDYRAEEKVKQIHRQFTDSDRKELDLNRYFPNYEIRPFLDGQILLIYVDELPDDEKYVFLNGRAYERLLTGDHAIVEPKIRAHEEYKEQIRNARELMPVVNTSIDDLDIDKLNHYIFYLNRIKKTETQKATIQEATSFLLRKKMIRDEQPTILGMLTCGKNPEDHLSNRCQVDCYVDHPSREIVALSRKLLRDTVIDLMEDGERFMMQNIDTGISVEKGGTTVYEYPPDLIRESINNSLAHRDYSIDRFVTLKVIPKKQIEIRNPGRFRQQLLIEEDVHGKNPILRIVSGDQQASNPNLANVLKVFNKWEGQGIGMTTLTGACLHNQVDLPYYVFHSKDELSLVIPSGKLLDKQMLSLFDTYSGYFKEKLHGTPLSEDQKSVLAYLYKSELANKKSRYTILLNRDNNHFDAITSLREAGIIYPDKRSNNFNPVFLLDRSLFRLDFTPELRELYGEEYDGLKTEYKEILKLLYAVNNFSEDKYYSANQIGNILWLQHANEGVIDGFEDFKRKIRYVVRRLESSGFIKRFSSDPAYGINEDFKKIPDLFRSNLE